jgi:hypothetical protein
MFEYSRDWPEEGRAMFKYSRDWPEEGRAR